MKQLYAEDLNYWQTSKVAAGTWIERASELIRKLPGGMVHAYAFGGSEGRQAHMLAFKIGQDNYKLVWPVLESRTKNVKAANTQAATMLYYDVKHRCILAKVFGARSAFLSSLLLPDGRTAAEATGAELLSDLPLLLGSGG